MNQTDKKRRLLEATVELLEKELAVENKDAFTRTYLSQRLAEIQSYLARPGSSVSKSQIETARNIVSNLSYAIDQIAVYNDPNSQFYKAVVGDLKDELEAACQED